MARKNVLTPQEISINQTMAASFTSPATMVPYMDNVAYQINITTTNSVGTFAIQGSLDYNKDPTTGVVTNPGNWITLTLSGTPAAAGANDQILISLNQVPFNAMRVAYTSTTAGTGACNIYVMLKQVGG